MSASNPKLYICFCDPPKHDDLSADERRLLQDFGVEAWSMIASNRHQEAQYEAAAYWDRVRALHDRPDEDDTDLDFGPMEDDTFGLDDVERDLYANT